MASPAQSKAVAEYRKRSVKQVVVRFFPKDAELYGWVRSQGGAAYLRDLAQADRLARGEVGDDGALPVG